VTTFRNQLDALSARFVADYQRRDALACAEAYTEDFREPASLHRPTPLPDDNGSEFTGMSVLR
jgi:hypothetical protein